MERSLLAEILNALSIADYNKKDVKYIASLDGSYVMSWKKFAKKADLRSVVIQRFSF